VSGHALLQQGGGAFGLALEVAGLLERLALLRRLAGVVGCQAFGIGQPGFQRLTLTGELLQTLRVRFQSGDSALASAAARIVRTISFVEKM